MRSTDSLWAAGVCAREDGAREVALSLPRVMEDEAAGVEVGAEDEAGGLLASSKLSAGSSSAGVFIARRAAAAPWASVVPLLRRQLVLGESEAGAGCGERTGDDVVLTYDETQVCGRAILDDREQGPLDLTLDAQSVGVCMRDSYACTYKNPHCFQGTR